MSNLDLLPDLTVCGGRAGITARPVRELLPGKTVLLGESGGVRRLLPNLGRRLVGAWCFIDHYGPDDISAGPGMQVPPHPHTGLQTVSWLLDGAVLHRDSLGSEQLVRPGELGLMTAGRAIAHSEESPAAHPPVLHGAQLWVALPDAHRSVPPAFEHHATPPVLDSDGVTMTVLLGELAGVVAPGTVYSPLVGVDVLIPAGADTRIAVEPDFEYAVFTVSGVSEVDGALLGPGSLLYLGCGRRELSVGSSSGARLLLLGGEPFDEEIVMWWNFVARTSEEVTAIRESWMSGDEFGTVAGFAGERLAAPELPPGRLRPRGRVR